MFLNGKFLFVILHEALLNIFAKSSAANKKNAKESWRACTRERVILTAVQNLPLRMRYMFTSPRENTSGNPYLLPLPIAAQLVCF